VLPLSSSFSSCSFVMNTLIFCLASLFFLQISTLCLHPFYKAFSLSNSSYNIAFSFSPIANLFFRLLTSIFKFLIFKLTIAIIWNNSIAFCVCINSRATSSTNFGVLICVEGFLDLYVDDPIFCTNMLPNSNSNGNPSINLGLVTNTYNSDGLNSTK